MKNKSLWEQLDRLNNPLVNFEWVKAHNGDRWNDFGA